MRRRILLCQLLGVGIALACGFDDTIREYLSANFWLPLSKDPGRLARTVPARLNAAYAGMGAASAGTPMATLRTAYQEIATPDTMRYDGEKLGRALAAARAVSGSLALREREEIALIDAKIDLRAGNAELLPAPLREARRKLVEFLRSAKTPELLSEARGWLAHVHYELGDLTAAGKIYLDELERADSNLSHATLVASLRMTYGYDGGAELIQHLDEYFDTPGHAAFAIHTITNPRWTRRGSRDDEKFTEPGREPSPPYARITALMEKHKGLLQSKKGTDLLALLGMRTALRSADPAAARRIAAAVPANSAVRTDPDYLWMLGSANFLTRNLAGAEGPLVRMFRSPRSNVNQKAAAAYGLCGVYLKLRNPVEQIRYALWLHTRVVADQLDWSGQTRIADQSVYWAMSGFDLALLLDAEAPEEALETFIAKNPGVPDVALVKYSLAVRLARENRYPESAELYQQAHAPARASRMRRMAQLSAAATTPEGRYRMAEFLHGNGDRIYFNDRLWNGLQRYVLNGATDGRLTRQERQSLVAKERQLQDAQEERWRAWLILKDVVRDSAPGSELGLRAARLAIRCVRGINVERFGREAEIRDADIAMTRWLRRSASAGD